MTIEIFVSYSHKDAAYVDGSRSLLDFLRDLDADFWYDSRISTGELWDREVKTHIDSSDLALVLVTQAFLNSPYIRNVEIERFLAKRKREGMVIFPVLVGPCDWKSYPWLAATQFFPRSGKTLREIKDRGKLERAYLQIRTDLKHQIERLQTSQRAPLKPARSPKRLLTAMIKQPPSAGDSSPAEAFGSVEQFVEAGDGVSAINRILAGKRYEDAAPEEQLDVAVVCQKLGRLSEARHYLDSTLAPGQLRSLTPALEARFRLLELKILSQEWRFSEVLKVHEQVIDRLLRTEQADRVSQVLHRAGIAHAVLGDIAASHRRFEDASGYADRHGNKHAQTTTQVFWSIASSFRGTKFAEDPARFVARAQLLYLEEATDAHLWQANRFKSAVQCLFSEAGMLFSRHNTESQAWIRLTAAHLLAPRARSHPHSEGYAELLALVNRDSIRTRLESAMQTDDEGRAIFQRQFLDQGPYLAACQKVLSIVQIPSLDRWRRLRSFFSRLDKHFG